MVDGRDLAAWKKALARRRRRGVHRKPLQPGAAKSSTSRRWRSWRTRAGALLFVDNVFATPLLQKPLKLGADIVIYSATKHIDGQGRALGGAILGRAQWIEEQLANFLRHTGPSLSPINAWLLLKGMETLELRVERMSRSAARWRRSSKAMPRSSACSIPAWQAIRSDALASATDEGGGTLLAFSVRGGKAAAFRCPERAEA